MERCVRDLDYAGCRELFASGVVGFGTRAFAAVGLDALERDQWRAVWSHVAGFRFLADELRCEVSGGLIAIAVPFDSRAVEPDGSERPRPGRATIVLVEDDGRLRAVHTHFSLAPS